MKTQELRKEIERLTSLDTIEDLFDLTDIFERFLYKVMESQDFSAKSAKEADAMTLLQMVFVKLLASRKLLSGIDYKDPQSGDTLNNLVDPTTVAAHLRNTFETISAFHTVYVKPESDDERLILYNLWVISGLKHRQQFALSAAGSDKDQILDDDQKLIDDYTAQIQDCDLYKSLDADNKAKITTTLADADFKLVFKGNTIKQLSWPETLTIMNLKKGLFDDAYAYFSFYTHPSNVSVFQFNQMFGKEESAYIDLAKYNFKNLMVMLSTFISDYIRLFPDRLSIYESLNLKDQVMIDAFNVLFRGHNKSINNAWKKII